MDNVAFRELMKDRTKAFALRVIRLYQALPKTTEAQVIGKQLLRSGTSVAANYRAACRGRSNAEFYSKISIVIEETDESLFWMEILLTANIMPKERLEDLMKETEEILKIVATARKNSRKKT
ncbi:MAG: four helix bundle protein [Bacteroidales bacterium]|nr:four helix bundle protein [Bacteroidales bacterium]